MSRSSSIVPFVIAGVMIAGCGGPAFPTTSPDGDAGAGGVSAGFSAMPVPSAKRDPAKAKCAVVEKLGSQGNVVASYREVLAGMQGVVNAPKTSPATEEEAFAVLCPKCPDLKRAVLIEFSGAHAYVVPRKDGKIAVHVLPRPKYTPPDCDGEGMLTGYSGKNDSRYVELYQTQRIDERECIDIRSRYLVDRETGELLVAAHGPAVKHGKDNLFIGLSDDESTYRASGGGCPEVTVLVR